MATSSGNEMRIRMGRGRGHFLQRFEMKNIQSTDNGTGNLCTIVQPKSTYIPKEINETDDSIYETGIECGINFDKLDEAHVNVGCVEVQEIIENFDSISTMISKNIEKCKFKKPTPIQKYTIPIILSGQDIMAAAQTGSGKTVILIVNFINYRVLCLN